MAQSPLLIIDLWRGSIELRQARTEEAFLRFRAALIQRPPVRFPNVAADRAVSVGWIRVKRILLHSDAP